MSFSGLGESTPLSVGGAGQVTGTSGAQKAPTGFSSTDSIGSAGGSSGSSTAQSYSPELMEALYVMWFSGGNPVLLQNTTGAQTSTTSIDAAAFQAEVSNKMSAICIAILDQWCENIKNEIAEDKKKRDSKEYMDWLARKGVAGHEAYLQSLTPEQRFRVEDFPNLERNIRVGEGGVTAIQSYARTMEGTNDPAVRDNLIGMTAALMIGGGMQYSYSGAESVNGGLVAILPLQQANETLFNQMAPNQSAELGYIGALFASSAAFLSIGMTLKTANVADEGSINYAFARNYATNLLKSVSSNEFNNFCMTLIAHSMEGSEPLNREQLDQLVKQTKVVLLATSLALLYKMESSFNGQGGGITGQEFSDLLDGNIENATAETRALAEYINGLLSDLPDGASLRSSLVSWVDTMAQNNAQLINVKPMIDGMVADYSNPSNTQA